MLRYRQIKPAQPYIVILWARQYCSYVIPHRYHNHSRRMLMNYHTVVYYAVDRIAQKDRSRGNDWTVCGTGTISP